jgi:serine/threonine-protein kinase
MAKIANEHAQRAEAVRQFLVGVFQRARPDENRGQPISAHELLEKGEQQVAASLSDQPALQADVTALLGELYKELSDFNRAETLLTHALATSSNAQVPTDVRARVLIAMASVEDENGAYTKGIAHAKQGLSLLKASEPGSRQEIANAHDVLSHCIVGSGDYAAAEAMLRETLRQDRRRQDAATTMSRSAANGCSWARRWEARPRDESEAAFEGDRNIPIALRRGQQSRRPRSTR